MTTQEISLDLVLRRPAGVPPARWTGVLTATCCQRLVPHLRSFAIGADHGVLSIGVPDGQSASLLVHDFEAVAAMIGALAPAPSPR